MGEIINFETLELDIISKMKQILKYKENIVISISGGSDSDILIDIFEKNKIYKKNKITYIFFDTGVEYEATYNHLDFLEKKYNIKIERLKPKINVPRSIKKYGTPYKSKTYSEFISRLQKHNFDFKEDGNKSFDELIKKYPNCKGALSWWCKKNYTINIGQSRKEKIINNPPTAKISAMCCYYSKKNLSKEYIKMNNVDLMILGIRKVEGGQRKLIYKSCWYKKQITKKKEIEFYLPLLHMTNKQKEEYSKERNIQNSECYTKYNLKRTGCIACPFSMEREHEMNILKKYEPKNYKAISKLYKNLYTEGEE